MKDSGGEQLLSGGGCGGGGGPKQPLLELKRESTELQPITGAADLAGEFLNESKRLWGLAAPAIFTSFCQYGLITATQIFAGHLGTTQLAALSVANNIISALPYSIMLGMSSALETYCGQAFGANELQMLGIYMQRTWLLLTAMAAASVPLFLFAASFLRLLGQSEPVSEAAGSVALWMIPQQFAYAMMLPSSKFLQAQSKVVAMAAIAAFALCLHSFLSWLLIVELGMGLAGAAAGLGLSWWFIAAAQFAYVVSGACGGSWSGFSSEAFRDLWGFFRVSVASAVMICLEFWYVMALTLFAGFLEDAEVSIDALSICVNILGWACMVALGLNVASSVRVSNELGTKNPRKTRFSVMVSGATSVLVGLVFTLVLILTRNKYPAIFSNSSEVQELVQELTPLLGMSIIFTNVQYTLSGVAIGAGWQTTVAYLSCGCYFVVGVPSGILLAYTFKMGVKGLWGGMVVGLCMQTCMLVWMISSTNWNKECSEAEERLRRWKGEKLGHLILTKNESHTN